MTPPGKAKLKGASRGAAVELAAIVSAGLATC
jgi:hypothetical protein